MKAVRFIGCLLLWVGLSVPALSAPLLSDISSRNIEIHSTFTGTQLLLFGARNEPGDIVVVVRGPLRDMVLRKKERRLGIWMNKEQVKYQHIPTFYRLASSRSLEEVRQYHFFKSLGIYHSLPLMGHASDYRDALQRLLREQGLYLVEEDAVEFMGESLFKVNIDFPDTMPRGHYTAEVYLFNDGQLISMRSIPVNVFKTGFDAFVYESSQSNSVFYGIFAVLMAVSIGWGTSWIFQRI